MIVVDASVALHALLSAGDARRELSLERIAAPHLVDSEIGHALRRMLRLGTISSPEAEQILEVWGQLGLQRFGVVGLLGRIWALRDNLSAHDATYVALAEALNCPLLTADSRIANAPGPQCTITVLPT